MHHLSKILVFSLIAEEGAISKAARRLNISVATASAHLDALENHLRGKLFIRSTRKLVLTDLGQLYLVRVQPILDQLAQADRLAKAFHEAPKGLLKVTTGTSIGRVVIAPAIGQFASRHADLEVHLNLDDSFLPLLSEGYDIAIRLGSGQEGNLVQRKLAPNQRVLVASPDYLEHAPKLRTPNDLADHVLLMHAESEDSSRALQFRIDGATQAVNFKGRLCSNNAEVPTAWVMNGYGIAQKSLWEVATAIAENKLIRLLEEYEPDPLDLYAVSPFRSGESTKVDMFVDFLRAKLREFPLATM